MGKSSLQDIVTIVEGETSKEFSTAIQAQSVLSTPSLRENVGPRSNTFIMNIAQQADEFVPWGMDLKARDAQLRSFWHTEPILASAVYMMAASLSVMGWAIEPADPDKARPKNTIMAVKRMLNNADRGNGWHEFMVKLATDVYTTDNGAFIELIRRENRPDSPVIGIAHLDSYRCYRTGDPETPVIYKDRMGVEHELKYWHVQTVEEMPSPIETMYGGQVCAVSRCLAAAQVIRDIRQYKHEKVSGLNPRAIHLISGFNQKVIEDNMTQMEETAYNRNLVRYVTAPIIATVDPNANISHEQIDMASLPDGFDEESTLQWYVAQLAMAFGVDYQEFAPLPGGTLGSSQQSEILHLKSRGKGPSLMIDTLEHVFNDNRIIPGNVKLEFKVQDARMDAERAKARFDRGKDRSIRLASGELDVDGARSIAAKDGDLTPETLEQMNARSEEMAQQVQNEPQQVQTQTSQQTDQPMQGSASHNTRKEKVTHDQRARTIKRLQDNGVLKLPSDLPEITEEDLQDARDSLKEWTEYGPVRRLGENLQARIHQVFTENADQWYANGMMSTEERIALSGAIGSALQTLVEQAPEEVMQRDLDDIEPALYRRPQTPAMVPAEVSNG